MENQQNQNNMRELKVVTMEELKLQMREDFDGEDEVINLYGCAAEDSVIGGTRRTLEELKRIGYQESTGIELKEDEVLPDGDWFPSRLKLAILMLAAHSHRNREPVSSITQNPVPYAFDVYVKPYRKLS